MSKTPDEPVFYHDTVHGLTGGPQDADRNAGRGGRTAGRTVRRAGRTQGRAPGRGELIPTRSIQVPINTGGGSTNRRRPRGSEVETEAEGPNKRQSVEVNSIDVAVNERRGLTVSPVWDPLPETQRSPSSLARSMGVALGSTSSTR